MIKKYKRKRSGWMRRTSRIYLTKLNKKKQSMVKDFLNNYANGVNYTIHRLWSESNDFDNDLLSKDVTNDIRKRFNVTARLAQCIGKQAKENVNSQKENSKRTQRIPRPATGSHRSAKNLEYPFTSKVLGKRRSTVPGVATSIGEIVTAKNLSV